MRSTPGSAPRVGQHEVLATGLADDPRVVPVPGEVRADLPLHNPTSTGVACKMMVVADSGVSATAKT